MQKHLRSWFWGVVTAGLTLVACGDDDPESPGGGGQGGSGAGDTTSVTTSSSTTASVSSTGQGGDDQGVASIEIEARGFCNFSCFELQVGEERQLIAKVLDDDGNELDLPVTWAIEDEAIATVDATGLAVGVSTGEVDVTATAGGVTGTATLMIVPKTVVTVEVTPQSALLATAGDTEQLTAVAKDIDGEVVPDAPISWSVASPGAADVDSIGLVTAVAQGNSIILATSGFASGWSSITVGSPISPVAPWTLSDITGGGYHACGLTDGGTGYCWGWNYFGQLGNGEVGDQFGNEPRPVPITGGYTFASLTTGLYHTCGITTAGESYCWGAGSSGELGNGDDTVLGSPTPLPIVGSHTFAKLAAGGSHTCGITTDGDLYCWGGNFDGQLGVGNTTNSWAPLQVSPGTTFSHVVTGLWNTCALTTAGEPFCWGSNSNGVLGNASPNGSEASPVAVSGGHTFTSIDEYGSFVCAIDDAGELWCWGRNDTGQVGDGTFVDANVPLAVETADTFVSVATGAHHTCAITTSGATRCWGDGFYGQHGSGLLGQSTSPLDVAGGLSFARLESGSHFTCGEITSGGVYCWGSSDTGQLGGGYGGMGLFSAVPVPLSSPN